MWWYGRGNSGGSWLPEEKKANMWHEKGNSGGSWPPAFPRSFITFFIWNILKFKIFINMFGSQLLQIKKMQAFISHIGFIVIFIFYLKKVTHRCKQFYKNNYLEKAMQFWCFLGLDKRWISSVSISIIPFPFNLYHKWSILNWHLTIP